MDHYIGIDAHSKTCTLVSLDQAGKLRKQAKIPTCESFLLKYIRSHQGPKKLVFEESHLSQWLYLLLKDEVDKLIVCNPTYIAKKQGAKTDFRDGLHLANELRCGHITPVYHEDTEIWTLRALVQGYIDINKQLTQCKNRYKALFRSQALMTDGGTIYTNEDRMAELSSVTDKFVAKHLFGQIKILEEIKKNYIDEFKKNSERHTAIKKLCSVPGISTIRATIVVALVCSPHRFLNKHKFWAYCMLVKYIDESDGATYGKRMIHGRGELKAVFDGAALQTLRGESSLRKHYDSLRAKGIGHKDAKKAVARKIAAICLMLLKNNEKYDDKYEEKKRRLVHKPI